MDLNLKARLQVFRKLTEYTDVYWDPEVVWWTVVVLPIGCPLFPSPKCQGMKDIAEDEERLANVREWVEKSHRGNFMAALRASPVIVSLYRTRPELDLRGRYNMVDGWHRLYEARAAKLQFIPTILVDLDASKY